MSQVKFVPRFGLSAMVRWRAGRVAGPPPGGAPNAGSTCRNGNGPQLLIGFDDDNQANVLIQAARSRISPSTALTSSTAALPMTSCLD